MAAGVYLWQRAAGPLAHFVPAAGLHSRTAMGGVTHYVSQAGALPGEHGYLPELRHRCSGVIAGLGGQVANVWQNRSCKISSELPKPNFQLAPVSSGGGSRDASEGCYNQPAATYFLNAYVIFAFLTIQLMCLRHRNLLVSAREVLEIKSSQNHWKLISGLR